MGGQKKGQGGTEYTAARCSLRGSTFGLDYLFLVSWLWPNGQSQDL